ncbi:pancreatic lipase-related protein 2-like [Battus philenor]|uniref:pancreatic lipase-related protein 2-like n=1 Tax=Battus philenor TaxID=42288 RepID=UPI0035D07D99
MHHIPLACFLSIIHPPEIQFENAVLQMTPIDKSKCPYMLDSSDVSFQLYTKYNPTIYQELTLNDDESLFASHIDFNIPTVIYFHAFMESASDGSSLMVREAYIRRGDTNIIMVEAQRLEAGPWYITAAENTWYIGQYAARFIDYLVSRGLKLSNTHLIGHSLGAQSAGVAGGALTSGQVARITALDPALPLFDKVSLEQRLDPSDAEFVDVIHTDMGIFGFPGPVGHADFYPNGGKSPQPGCNLEVVLTQQLLLNKFFCSHWRSYMFYAESVVRPESFVASQCSSWQQYRTGKCASSPQVHMGFGVDRNARGNFYLITHKEAPFSIE